MKQKIRPLLLFKKRSAFMQRVSSNTYALANRLMDETLFGGLRPINGYTGPATGCGDADGLSVTVNFNQDVTFTSHAGVDISATGGKTFNITGPVGGTANQIEYVGTWTVEPIAGDVITYQYTAASGNYTDSEGEPMADAGPLTLRNCLDPVFVTVPIVGAWSGAKNCA